MASPSDPARAEDPGTGSRWAFLTPAFTLLCVFYFLVFFAGYQVFPIVPLHLRNLGASLAESGRFMTAFTLGAALGGLFTGPLGDSLGSRRVLRGASLLMVLFLAVYLVLPVPWAFTLLAPLHGIVWSGLRTASVAKAGGMLPEAHRAEGISIFGMSSPAGVALGPLVGLALWPLLGFRGTMAVLALAFVALHLMAGRLPRERATAVRGPFRWPELSTLSPVLISGVLGLSYGPIPPFAAQEARLLGSPWPSALLACLGLGIVGLRFLLGTRGMGAQPIRMMPWLLALTASGHLLLAFAPGGALRHALGGSLYGAGFGMAHTLLFMHVMETSSPDRRGAGIGALYFAYDAGQAVGALGVGHLMEAIGHRVSPQVGFRAGWLACGLAVLGVVALGRRIARRAPIRQTS